MKTVLSLICVCVLFNELHSSAIPMWEYLSKQEKMSYLYSMFSNQVESFCSSIYMDNCTKELLKYGLNKLKLMPEDHLDSMDPYQRDAHDIIWDAMMEGHEMMAPKEKTSQLVTTTRKSNSFADDSSDLDVGTQTAASAKVDNVYRVTPPKEFTFKSESGTPQYTYPHNLVPYLSTIEKINSRNEKRKDESTRRNTFGDNSENNIYTGAMVIKVYPDGTPIPGLPSLLPQDDDLHHYKYLKAKVPHL